MRARRLSSPALATLDPDELTGAVLLGPVRLPDASFAKGTRLDPVAARRLTDAAAAGSITEPVRLGWPDPGDLHEDEAAADLARAVAGEGVDLRPPRQSRLDLTARWDGVLHVRAVGLARVNAIDPLEVFTLFHGQAVTVGQTVASVKVAPHLVRGSGWPGRRGRWWRSGPTSRSRSGRSRRRR
jgi:molybdenum cofactor cytidylyltransferase